MTSFRLEDFTNSSVMHCSTKEQALIFLNLLHKNGRKWRGGESYIETTHHQKYGSNTCYNFNDGTYCDVEYFEENNYEILEFSDFYWEGYVNKDDITSDKSSDEKMDKFLSLFAKV